MSGPARRFSRVELAEGVRQFAVFILGELEYAIDILSIRQIVRPQAVRPVPKAPAFIHGVVDLRGHVIPVLDLGHRFGLGNRETTRASKLIIVQCSDRLLALHVDRVLGVIRVSRDELQPTPQWITGAEAAVFSGLCRREGHIVLILDLSALLSLGEEVRLRAFEVHPNGRRPPSDDTLDPGASRSRPSAEDSADVGRDGRA